MNQITPLQYTDPTSHRQAGKTQLTIIHQQYPEASVETIFLHRCIEAGLGGLQCQKDIQSITAFVLWRVDMLSESLTNLYFETIFGDHRKAK